MSSTYDEESLLERPLNCCHQDEHHFMLFIALLSDLKRLFRTGRIWPNIFLNARAHTKLLGFIHLDDDSMDDEAKYN